MNTSEHDPNDVYRVLFVYGKGGRVKCLTLDEAKREEAGLLACGWVHTATIQPARWIECLVNDEGAAIGKMDELRWGISFEEADSKVNDILDDIFSNSKSMGKGVTLLSEIELDQMEDEHK